MKGKSFASLVLGLGCATASAFEPETHARIAAHAVDRSALVMGGSLYDQLGLTCDIFYIDPKSSGRTVQPFGQAYFSFVGDVLNERLSEQYDFYTTGSNTFTVKDWVMRGVVREDGNPSEDIKHGVTQGDLWPIDREFNHFFDPTTNRELTSFAAQEIYFGETFGNSPVTAPSWALGVNDIFVDAVTPAPGQLNHYSIMNTHEAMFRALTGKTSSSSLSGASEAIRKEYWATVFRSIGACWQQVLFTHSAAAYHSGDWGSCGTFRNARRRIDLTDSKPRTTPDKANERSGRPNVHCRAPACNSRPRYRDEKVRCILGELQICGGSSCDEQRLQSGAW